MKQFDEWNTKKKKLNTNTERKFYHEREIWWCRLGANVGFEQDGKGVDFQRPVLVIRAWSRETCVVLPLTTSRRQNKYLINIGPIIADSETESQVIISQIRLIDTKRLEDRITILNKEKFFEIKKTLKDIL